MLVRIDVVPVAHDLPGAQLCRKTGLGDAVHEPLGLKAMRNDLRDGYESESVFLCELLELRSAGTRPVFAQDLADHARGTETGEPRQIHCGFGVADTLKHSAIACAEGRHVARTAKI